MCAKIFETVAGSQLFLLYVASYSFASFDLEHYPDQLHKIYIFESGISSNNFITTSFLS
jgi:hypothetical protein